MKHDNLLATIIICATVIITVGMFAKAGDLDPPAGANQPPTHTLDDVYDKVRVLPEEFPLYPTNWEAAYVHLNDRDGHGPATTPVDVISGSGVLHAVVITGSASPQRYTIVEVIVDGETIGIMRTGANTMRVILDTMYSEEVAIKQGFKSETSHVTLLYRPDPNNPFKLPKSLIIQRP